ncbi:MAG: aldo/keto reductase [Oscillospiraceae bacterium]|nr:aldo/keto reductase [Oscillospiraceae bacterium]
MQYRDFGQTGEKISALGFGCMHLPEIHKDGRFVEMDFEKGVPMLHKAFDEGVNYYDSAPYYCQSQSEIVMGRALKDRRSKVLLSTKCPLGDVKTPAGYREQIEKSLRKMETDYIDFYHFWGIGKGGFDDQIMKHDLLGEAAKAKEAGLIRHISFSFHDDPKNIKYIIDGAIKYGVPMETMLVQYNLLDRASEEGIAYAASKGVGVVAMGPVGGGRLAAPTQFGTGISSAATYELAIKFVLGNPGICCALSGMRTMEQVEMNVEVGKKPALTEQEWKDVAKAVEDLRKFSDLYCTGCNYCQPCPADIKIPHLFHQYTLYNVYGLRDAGKNGYRHYKVVEKKPAVEQCTDCGLCEEKCPQKLEIRALLKKVDEVMMSL